MAITNSEQLLAQDLIDELEDERKRAFGMYMRMIKTHGEQPLRALLSEVKDDFATGKIYNKAKIFMWRVKKWNHERRK